MSSKAPYVGRGGSREGAGRPGVKSHVVRVPEGVTREDVEVALSLVELLTIHNAKNFGKDSPRYYFWRKFVDDVKAGTTLLDNLK